MKKLIPILFSIYLMASPGLGAQSPGIQVSVSPGDTGKAFQLEVEFLIPPGLHQTLQTEYFGLRITPGSIPPEVQVGEVIYPKSTKFIGSLASYEGTAKVIIPFKILGDSQSFTLQGEVLWQLCYDDGVCLIPQSRAFTLPISLGPQGYGAQDLTVVNLDQSSAFDDALGPEEPEETPPTEGYNLWLILIFGFLGGLILNLMPCVLPVLSIKLISLVKLSGDDKKSRWAHGWAALLGVLTSLLTLGGLLIGLQAAGFTIGWGIQFQNPWYVVGLLVLVFGFALSLFDLFLLSSPSIRGRKIQGLGGSFFSGFLTVVLATPCSAPFLGTALGLAFSSPWWVILLSFGSIGLGLGLPFFLLSVIPGASRFLPKPGPWMDIFRGLMAFGLVATGIWLLTVLNAQIEKTAFANVLWFLGALVLGIWIYGTIQRSSLAGWKNVVARSLLLLGILGAGVFFLKDLQVENSKASSFPSELPSGWQEFSETTVKENLEQGNMVFIDFTADWCLTCQVNEAGPLSDPQVLNKFNEKGVVLLRGDYTKPDPVITRWLKKYQRAGVPFYALLGPGEKVQVLPEFLSTDILLQALKD